MLDWGKKVKKKKKNQKKIGKKRKKFCTGSKWGGAKYFFHDIHLGLGGGRLGWWSEAEKKNPKKIGKIRRKIFAAKMRNFNEV